MIVSVTKCRAIILRKAQLENSGKCFLPYHFAHVQLFFLVQTRETRHFCVFEFSSLEAAWFNQLFCGHSKTIQFANLLLQ